MKGCHDDARTNLAIAQTAAREGAIMLNYCQVVRFLRKSDKNSAAGNDGTYTVFIFSASFNKNVFR